MLQSPEPECLFSLISPAWVRRAASCRRPGGLLPQAGRHFAADWAASCRRSGVLLPQAGRPSAADFRMKGTARCCPDRRHFERHLQKTAGKTSVKASVKKGPLPGIRGAVFFHRSVAMIRRSQKQQFRSVQSEAAGSVLSFCPFQPAAGQSGK